MTTATLTPPPADPKAAPAGGPTKHLWTVDEYRQLGGLDCFRGVKTMLLGGEIYTMVMPAPPHDVALNLAYRFVFAACPTGHHVRNQQGFDVGTRTDPGPDLAVVPGDIRDDGIGTPTTAVLIIEVAHTSLDMDTSTKAEVYATAGVPDYWVIDIPNRRLLVFRDPVALPAGLGATAYRTRLTLTPADTVAPLAAPASAVKVADLLP